ncbi:MAG: hypothetical protein ACREA9_15000, partial [Pyrinomonadaceae bacterium]
MTSYYRKSLVFVFAVFCAALLTATSPRATFAQTEKQPPLIDRELFFGDPEISGAQISPDGKFLAFVKPFKGTRNVW